MLRHRKRFTSGVCRMILPPATSAKLGVETRSGMGASGFAARGPAVQPLLNVGWRVANQLADLAVARAPSFAAPVTQRGHGNANPPRHIPLIEQRFDPPIPRIADLGVPSNRFHAPIFGQGMCRRSM